MAQVTQQCQDMTAEISVFSVNVLVTLVLYSIIYVLLYLLRLSCCI